MILCENGPGGRAALFEDAEELVFVHRPADLAPALRWLEAARGAGAWVAGYMSYEAGLALEPKLSALPPRALPGGVETPLLAFGIYAGPRSADAILSGPTPEPVRLAPLRPLVDRAAHAAQIARVKDYIAAGDCYQINLTFPIETRLEEGTALDLYRALRVRQAVGHGAFVDFGVGPALVSRSPELFFRTDAAGGITARPMKGTAPRDADPVTDAALAMELAGSEKNRAENLMIVDLLRNDIARIAEVGSVRVPELFAVESFATVHQMSSTVTGRLGARARGLPQLMAALFPCGSITGAPKIRAMEIIAEIEPFGRGAYCGAIGWMGPDGTSCFSVAIRTLSVFGERVVMNVGGGVVQDSTAEGEWEEALWKAAYAATLARPG